MKVWFRTLTVGQREENVSTHVRRQRKVELRPGIYTRVAGFMFFSLARWRACYEQEGRSTQAGDPTDACLKTYVPYDLLFSRKEA